MIKFNEIIKNVEYRERVIKYFRLPIRLSVSLDKFLSDIKFIKETNLDQYNLIVACTEHDFNKLAKEQGTDRPDFAMENILEPVLEKFRNNPRWQEFLEKDYSNVLDDFHGVKNTHSFYTKENSGKYFLSIDLEAANWQSLQSIIGFTETYEEMIVKYTSNLIPPISKTFRTKITGLLGARNIMHYNKKLIKDNYNNILTVLSRESSIKPGMTPFAFYADEVLFEIDEFTHNELKQLDLEERVTQETGIKTHITTFKLKWLNVEKICVKVFDEKNYELLNISKDIKMLYDKDLHGIKPNDFDFEKINLRGKTRDEYIKMIKDSNNEIKRELEKSLKSLREFNS